MSRAKNSNDTHKLAYNYREAGFALGVSPKTVYRLAKDGELNTSFIRGRRVVLADSLLAMLERGRAEAVARS